MTIALDPGTLQARGRNGWFRPVRAEVYNFDSGDSQLEIFSKSMVANCAPILLRGPRAELRSVLTSLLAVLEQSS